MFHSYEHSVIHCLKPPYVLIPTLSSVCKGPQVKGLESIFVCALFAFQIRPFPNFCWPSIDY